MKQLNIDSLVRSAVCLAVGLPLVLGLNGVTGTLSRLAEDAAEIDGKTEAIDQLKSKLALPCLKYVMAKVDSKLERDAKNEVDEILGGEVMIGETCQYVLR